jgi:hypothetical protein
LQVEVDTQPELVAALNNPDVDVVTMSELKWFFTDELLPERGVMIGSNRSVLLQGKGDKPVYIDVRTIHARHLHSDLRSSFHLRVMLHIPPLFVTGIPLDFPVGKPTQLPRLHRQQLPPPPEKPLGGRLLQLVSCRCWRAIPHLHRFISA